MDVYNLTRCPRIHTLRLTDPPLPVPMIAAANAELLGSWLQLFATGAYLVYLPECMTILRTRSRQGASLWLPMTCSLMFGIALATDVLDLTHAYQAFSVHSPEEEPDPTAVFADVSSTRTLVKNSLIVTLAIMSDVIMVYRTLVVWSHNVLVILIPSGFLIVDAVFAVWAIWTLAHTSTGDDAMEAAATSRAGFFLVFTFCVNVVCAGLICWKIWLVNRRSPARVHLLTSSPGRHVFEVILETAALYCAHLLLIIITNYTQSNLFFTFLDALPPMTALVFTLLIVRGRPTGDAAPSILFSETARGVVSTRDTRRSGYSAHPIQIEFERTVCSECTA